MGNLPQLARQPQSEDTRQRLVARDTGNPNQKTKTPTVLAAPYHKRKPKAISVSTPPCATRATIKSATLIWAQPHVAQAPSMTPPKPAQNQLSPIPPPAPTRALSKEDPHNPKSSGKLKKMAHYKPRGQAPQEPLALVMNPTPTKDFRDGNELPARNQPFMKPS